MFEKKLYVSPVFQEDEENIDADIPEEEEEESDDDWGEENE